MIKHIIMLLALLSISNGFSQEWLSDIDKAKKVAQKNNRNILLVFSGSDWCAPCIKLEREIWKSSEFQSYAKNNIVLLKVDFPKKKASKLPKEQQKKNKRLAEKYNSRGFFPLIVVLNSKGGVIGKMPYKKMSPTDYINYFKSL